MDAILDAITLATRAGASDAERHRGAVACRALADALGAPGSPGPDPAPSSTALVAAPALGLGANPFGGMTADQIFDLAIAKLRAAVGNDVATAAPVGQPFRVTLVPVARRP